MREIGNSSGLGLPQGLVQKTPNCSCPPRKRNECKSKSKSRVNGTDDRSSTPHEAQFIVVGAGPSGSYAARVLHDHGIRVKLVEAKDRVGERTWSSESEALGGPVDFGGQWICETHVLLPKLGEKLRLESVSSIMPAMTYSPSMGRGLSGKKIRFQSRRAGPPSLRSRLSCLTKLVHVWDGKLCGLRKLETRWTG